MNPFLVGTIYSLVGRNGLGRMSFQDEVIKVGDCTLACDIVCGEANECR